ncbi:MAG TPA: hypothetical protein PLR99_19100 [Polyangiaceae bacterium]|nr:hypothetical protein [Polyangiaceae bacterium]
MNIRFALIMGLGVALAATGCKKKGAAGADAGAGAEAVDPPAAAALKQNPAVLEHLKKLADGCTVSIDSASVYSCKNKEDSAFYDWIRASRPKDLYETYASVIAGTDVKAKAVAISQANNTFSTLDKDLKKANATKAVANAFLDALEKDDSYAVRLAGPTSDLAFLAGQKTRLFKVTDGLHNTPARNTAYRTFMEFGRLDAFEKLKEVAKDKDFTVAALAAPRNMYDWTGAEKAAICPWAKGFLGDASLAIAAEAGYDAIKCKGEYVDALQDEGDKRLKNKQFDEPFAMVFREVCFEFIGGVTGQAGANPQCKRNYAFLERVTNDESVKPEVRGRSLWNIYYQRRDKESLALMRKYEKHKNPEISKRAKEAIQSLTTTYKLK